jgi:hypothetical protein
MARSVTKLEFWPGDATGVLAAMGQIDDANEGWINLLPGIAEPQEAPRVPGPLSALFGGGQTGGTTMCTWMPAKGRGRNAHEGMLGIMHPKGRHVVRQLAQMNIALPEGWRVRVDHQRRGLVAGVPQTAPHGLVLEWAIEAGSALCVEPQTGRWQAVIYWPRGAEAPPSELAG